MRVVNTPFALIDLGAHDRGIACITDNESLRACLLEYITKIVRSVPQYNATDNNSSTIIAYYTTLGFRNWHTCTVISVALERGRT